MKSNYIYSVIFIDCKNEFVHKSILLVCTLSLFKSGSFFSGYKQLCRYSFEGSQYSNYLRWGFVFSLPVDGLPCASSFMSDCHWCPAGSGFGSRQCGAKYPGVSIAVKPYQHTHVCTMNLNAQTGRHIHRCRWYAHMYMTCILHMHAQMYACSHRPYQDSSLFAT